MARVIFPFPPASASGKRKPLNVGPALQHGQPVYIFDLHEQVGIQPARAITKARQKLKEINVQETDFLAWVGGDPAGLAVISALMSEMNSGKVRWLHFDRVKNDPNRSGYYIPTMADMRRP